MLAAHLLLGVLPSLPFVECDHCVNTKNSTVPETVWRPAHEAYGPLFTLLRGRQWVFTAGAITTDARASMRSNVFTTHDGRRMVAPLVSVVAPNQHQTNVTIVLPSSLTPSSVTVWAPGDVEGTAVGWNVAHGHELTAIAVPLHMDGCAVVVVEG